MGQLFVWQEETWGKSITACGRCAHRAGAGPKEGWGSPTSDLPQGPSCVSLAAEYVSRSLYAPCHTLTQDEKGPFSLLLSS